MSDCPEYFGLLLFSGFIGVISPSDLYFLRVFLLISSSAHALFTQNTASGLQVGGNSLISLVHRMSVNKYRLSGHPLHGALGPFGDSAAHILPIEECPSVNTGYFYDLIHKLNIL